MTTSEAPHRIWTAEDNKQRMQVSDDAYNARDIAHFNHHDHARIFYPTYEIDMPAHNAEMIEYYASFPDIKVHNHEYRLAIAEGAWTTAIAQVSGTNTGPLRGSGGLYLPPTSKSIDILLSTVAHWEDGLLVEEHLFMDTTSMMRQLGFVAATGPFPRPVEVGDAPTTGRPATREQVAENKRRAKASDDAFNTRQLDAHSLGYADTLVAHFVGADPMDLAGYLQYLQGLLVALPDLHIHNEPYKALLGEGDWTSTVAQWTGTQTGPLVLPQGMAGTTVPTTGKPISLSVNTIARWSHDHIDRLVMFFDFPGVLRQLGVA